MTRALLLVAILGAAGCEMDDHMMLQGKHDLANRLCREAGYDSGYSDAERVMCRPHPVELVVPKVVK